ncbi:hypothetical protein M408DRAFT_329555 [Serendipita vermifera MAFF 305830]|uniref:Secreted protein n=1 Tax=Serendipita vermifera MAFF 305830 TaxID=933852 RepID=A0A0C3B9R9_SERVB|nr:hypothetical protein M408DRAFT_329555 [Serendipita vermifera MAFF 305830]
MYVFTVETVVTTVVFAGAVVAHPVQGLKTRCVVVVGEHVTVSEASRLSASGQAGRTVCVVYAVVVYVKVGSGGHT